MAIDIDALRELVLDSDEAVFSDEALDSAAAAAGDNILRAAGIAYTSLAALYAVQGKSIRTEDLAIDTRGRGADLLKVAQSFFAEANAADATAGADVFLIVPFAGRDSTYVCRVEASPYPVSCCVSAGCEECVL